MVEIRQLYYIKTKAHAVTNMLYSIADASANTQESFATETLFGAMQPKHLALPLVQGQLPVADAVLLLPPYYFASVPDAGIANFLLAVLQTTKLPSYLYNYSVHTGNVISTESYKKVAKQLPHLRGIKCTVTAMSDATPYKEAMPHLQVSRRQFNAFCSSEIIHSLQEVTQTQLHCVMHISC